MFLSFGVFALCLHVVTTDVLYKPETIMYSLIVESRVLHVW